MSCEGDGKNNYATWQSVIHNTKPLTVEDMQEALDRCQALARRPRDPPKRIVSPRVYAEAELAISQGATASQLEWVLLGIPWERAKSF